MRQYRENSFDDGTPKNPFSVAEMAKKEITPDKEIKTMPETTPSESTNDSVQQKTLTVAQSLQALLDGSTGISEDVTLELTGLKERVQLLESDVDFLVKKAENQPKKLSIKIGTSEYKDAGVQHKQFPLILTLIGNKIKCALIGGAGGGKTTTCENVAEFLGLKYYYSPTVYEPYSLIGFMDANGDYVETQFFEWYTKGGLFLFDDTDRSIPKALTAIHAGIDNGKMAFPHGLFEQHPDCVCIFTMNTYGRGQDRQYVGANQLDGATMDRVAKVNFDYDEDLEIIWADPQSDKENEYIAQVQAWRKACYDLRIQHIISPRASINGCTALRAGVDIKTVHELFIWGGLEIEQKRKIKEKAVKNA